MNGSKQKRLYVSRAHHAKLKRLIKGMTPTPTMQSFVESVIDRLVEVKPSDQEAVKRAS